MLGAQQSGAETETVRLSECNIIQCIACDACQKRTDYGCVHDEKDDFLEIVNKCEFTNKTFEREAQTAALPSIHCSWRIVNNHDQFRKEIKMSVEQKSYDEARKEMQPGDVIAFGGKGNFSEIIKFATFSDVSHVGVILQTKITEDETDRYFNQIIESTSLNDFNGVNISRFSDRLNSYEGDLWWLPLKMELRLSFNQKKFYDFLFDQAKRKIEYDMPQAINSALDVLDSLPFDLRGPTYNREDFSKFFCSELVAAGLEKAGVTGSINASEVTPIDLCRWNIYEDKYYLLKGDPKKKISRFNTSSPSDWNV
jgi:hypothetical protein